MGRETHDPQTLEELTMIHAYSSPTPNGHKVHIMLSECNLAHEIIPIDIAKGNQFDPYILSISPNNRIPAIADTDGPDGGECRSSSDQRSSSAQIARRHCLLSATVGTAGLQRRVYRN
jgi:hypothetical protein